MVAMVVVAFGPAFQGGFIWDDDDYITRNPLLSASDGLWRIWLTTDSPSQYFPLVYTAFRIEHSIWGLDPLGYHAVNIFLHAANAILIWLLLARLRVPGAWLAAAIWAVHPVQVESVAWIVERKNVLSTLFYVLSLLSWNAFLERPERARRHYALAIVTCALALFAKTTACTLPAAMLVMAWWKRHSIDRKRILQVVPFVVISTLMGLVTMWWEKVHQGTSGQMFAFTPIERLLIMSRAIWFYLEKLVLPRNLAFSYPKWDIQPTDLLQYLPVAALIATAVVLWLRRNSARGTIAAGLFFALTLAPMLGIISLWTFRYTYVADHYQYLACLGPIAWFAAATTRIRSEVWRVSLVVVLLGTLGTVSFLYTRVFRSEETIWLDVLAKDPRSFMACNNLGVVYYQRGAREEAVKLFTRAIEINPADSEAHLNLGVDLYSRNQVAEAIREYELALKYLPRYARAHRELCAALERVGRLDEAIEHGETAVELAPENAAARLNLGLALAAAGRPDDSIVQFRSATRLEPGMAEAHFNLATVLMQRENVDEAIQEYGQALQINPGLSNARINLAALLYEKGEYSGAWQQVHEARRMNQQLDPEFLRALSRKMSDPAPDRELGLGRSR